MKINYQEFLRKNMLNTFIDVLKHIKSNGLQENHHLYITIDTNNKNLIIPKWLKKKHPLEMTIVIQHEYWDFKINNNSFSISLSFNDIKANLIIPFDSVISFADPYANFGLKLNSIKINNENKLIDGEEEINIKKNKVNYKNNILQFNKVKDS